MASTLLSTVIERLPEGLRTTASEAPPWMTEQILEAALLYLSAYIVDMHLGKEASNTFVEAILDQRGVSLQSELAEIRSLCRTAIMIKTGSNVIGLRDLIVVLAQAVQYRHGRRHDDEDLAIQLCNALKDGARAIEYACRS